MRRRRCRATSLAAGALLALAAAVGVCGLAAVAAAVPIPREKSPDDAAFYNFLHAFRPVALAAGVPPQIYDRAVADISFNLRVKELNEQQPEFVRPIWDYLSGVLTDARIARGQALIAQNAALLNRLERRDGVPREILVAIWGIESNFGENTGSFNLFEALATLASGGPRQGYGRREMLAALELAERQNIDPKTMNGSWAGAVGQTQFIPTTYLAHAVDGDGDGKCDLWRSAADALASTAEYLRRAGWIPGEPWGEEVTLPRGFAYEDADPDIFKSVDAWNALGVRKVDGGALDGGKDRAWVFLPAGARGPAFLVRGNFDAILKYNTATAYALAVGLLSDRLQGGAAVTAHWPEDEMPLDARQRMSLQEGLNALGYASGAADGVLGRRTRGAIRHFQKANALPADGFATRDLLERVNALRMQKGV